MFSAKTSADNGWLWGSSGAQNHRQHSRGALFSAFIRRFTPSCCLVLVQRWVNRQTWKSEKQFASPQTWEPPQSPVNTSLHPSYVPVYIADSLMVVIRFNLFYGHGNPALSPWHWWFVVVEQQRFGATLEPVFLATKMERTAIFLNK